MTDTGGASRVEFEQRFWIIGLIFGLGFAMSAFDSSQVADLLAQAITPGADPASPAAEVALRGVVGCAAVLVFAAAALRTWATAYLRSEVVHDSAQHSIALVADGPFRYVRNPLYFANVLLAAGVGVLASCLGWLVMVGGMWAFVRRLITREEHGLRQSLGEPFASYARAVPRLWPALTPRLPAGPHTPRWGQAVAGEMFVWLFGVAVTSLAVTLDMRVAGAAFSLGIGAYFVIKPFITRPRA